MLLPRRLPFAVLAATLLLGLAAPAAAHGNHEQVVDLTFPTDARATYTDTYDAPRGDRVHLATDLMGTKGWKVYAALGGTVCWISGADEAEPSYGYMLTICGDDGRSYHYVHLNNDTPGSDDGAGGPEHAYAPGIADGARVQRGAHIAWMGDSGNAEGTQAHLHFQIEDPDVTDPYGSHYLNPYFSLLDAEERGDYADGAVAASDADDEAGDADAGGEAGDDGDGGDGPDGGDEGDSGDGGEVSAAGGGIGPAETTTAAPVARVAGSDRVGTAAALARTSFQAAGRVVISSAQSLPDAVAAGPLAAAVDAPVLITWRDGLDDRVAEEVRRLGATRATLVGGDVALSAQVERDLAAKAGIEPEAIERIAGADGPATAAAVARAVWAAGGPRRATVALGVHTGGADALASGWYGAVTGTPVLLTLPGQLPPSTADALDGVDEAVIVGGAAAVPEDVAAAIAEHAATTRRLAGPDRYATAAAVATELVDAGVSLQRVWVTAGASWADALAAGPAVARAGETLLLVDGTAAGGDGSVDAWLREHAERIDSGLVVGGRAAVSDAAAAVLADRIA